MNKNKILTNDWSDVRSRAMYQKNWPDDEICRELHEAGDECGACSFFAPFNSDWGLCCNEKSRHSMETVFNQFTCPSYVREGRGPHSFTEIQEAHCHCGGRPSPSQTIIEFEIGDIRYKLTRLRDGDYYELREDSLHIEDDFRLYLHLELSRRFRGEEFDLARMYTALSRLCGKSGRMYDDHYSSFSFPFSLAVKKAEQEFAYLLDIHDHRGEAEFRIRKLIDPDDDMYDKRARMTSHKPFEEEFSRNEINEFIVFLYGYLEGYFTTVKMSHDEFFFKVVPSGFGIYGYKDECFFEDEYESEQEFQQAVKALKEMERN